MLKVACESCQAPYQVDERRVPPSGLKMRCPKCGHSFLVTAPAAGGASGVAPAPPAPQVPPAPRAPAEQAQVAAPPRPASVASVPRPATARMPTAPGVGAGGAPQGSPPVSKKTIVGLAPPSVPPRKAPPPSLESTIEPEDVTSDFPAALGFLDDADLPVVPADLPAAKGAPPRPVKPQPPPAPRRAPDVSAGPGGARPPGAKTATSQGSPGIDSDLPVAAVGLPAVRSGEPASPFEVDLPTPVADLPVATAALPAVFGGAPRRPLLRERGRGFQWWFRGCRSCPRRCLPLPRRCQFPRRSFRHPRSVETSASSICPW